MMKDIERARTVNRNDGQRKEIMLAQNQNRQAHDPARRPLYDSVWLSFFELLRAGLASRSTPALSRDGSLSHRQ
jgi:hypothetical protein